MTEVQARWQRGRVRSADLAAEDIRRIVIDTDLAMRAEPGSHVDVRVHLARDGSETDDVRSYSVVESAPDGRSITLGVRRSPTSRGGSAYMHSLAPGTELEVTTPLQNFPLRMGARRYVLVAGGIGITAIVSMARVLARAQVDYTFVYVGRRRSAMAFLPDLVAEHGDRLRVITDDEGGRLDVAGLVRELADDPAARSTELYMCGPIGLMDAIRRSWTDHGLPVPNLRYETFGNSGRFAAEDFVVRVPRLGIETVVTAQDSIIDALERAGADVMYDCRKGECGLCRVDVLEVDGELDHRDVFFSDKEKAAGDRICTCVSRAIRPTGDNSRRCSRAALVLDLP